MSVCWLLCGICHYRSDLDAYVFIIGLDARAVGLHLVRLAIRAQPLISATEAVGKGEEVKNRGQG